MTKQINEWKSKYGRVLRMALEGQDVYFRTLTCREMQYLKGKEETAIKVVPDLVILNNVKLKAAGSKYRLSEYVLEKSIITDGDDLQKAAIENRLKIRKDFTLSLIKNICSVFVSYTPDQLMDKTTSQLMEIVAMAEAVTGRHIIETGDEPKKPPTAMPTMREGTAWEDQRQHHQELMDESVNALNKKIGKKVPTVAEAKGNNSELGDLQKQMKELESFSNSAA